MITTLALSVLSLAGFLGAHDTPTLDHVPDTPRTHENTVQVDWYEPQEVWAPEYVETAQIAPQTTPGEDTPPEEPVVAQEAPTTAPENLTRVMDIDGTEYWVKDPVYVDDMWVDVCENGEGQCYFYRTYVMVDGKMVIVSQWGEEAFVTPLDPETPIADDSGYMPMDSEEN